jgi:hypothetical protein
VCLPVSLCRVFTALHVEDGSKTKTLAAKLTSPLQLITTDTADVISGSVHAARSYNAYKRHPASQPPSLWKLTTCSDLEDTSRPMTVKRINLTQLHIGRRADHLPRQLDTRAWTSRLKLILTDRIVRRQRSVCLPGFRAYVRPRRVPDWL